MGVFTVVEIGVCVSFYLEVINDGWQVVLLCVSVSLDVKCGVQCCTVECKHCSQCFLFFHYCWCAVGTGYAVGTPVCCVVNERPPQSGGASEAY